VKPTQPARNVALSRRRRRWPSAKVAKQVGHLRRGPREGYSDAETRVLEGADFPPADLTALDEIKAAFPGARIVAVVNGAPAWEFGDGQVTTVPTTDTPKRREA